MPDLTLSIQSTENFIYTGSVQSWTVPAGVFSVTLTANGSSAGANGGRAIGTLSVTPGVIYYYRVGGSGEGGAAGSPSGSGGAGQAGGGMTWFSTQNTFGQASVIIVAAGAGGNGSGGSGGNGGGTTGDNGTDGNYGNHGVGGSQVGGGGGGFQDGQGGSAGDGGRGGNGQSGYNNGGGGGGGQGYYGGGGGGTNNSNNVGTSTSAGGGGGSSFLHASLTSTSTTTGAHSGTGTLQLDYAITILYDSETNVTDTTVDSGGNAPGSPPLKIPLPLGQASNPVFDLKSITELLFMNSAVLDFNCTANISGYKWLTKSLLTAQQQFSRRPAFMCKIRDDDVVFSSSFTAPAQPTNGQVVAAPDGTLLAVGGDSSGNLGFWKITDGSIISQWTAAPTEIIRNSGLWGSAHNVSISVSDYVNGMYVIDVYYFTDDTASPSIATKRSIDSGLTFGSHTLIGGALTTTTGQYISAGKPLLLVGGTITGISFLTYADVSSPTLSEIYYNYFDGASWTRIMWTPTFANTGEWAINSLDNFYYYDNSLSKGMYYVVFSGYHGMYSPSSQPGLYLSKFYPQVLGSTTDDIWSLPAEILVSDSSSVQNLNKFTLPKFNYDGEKLWLTFRGETTETIDESGYADYITNYYLCYSADFENFTYPSQLLSSSGSNVNPDANNSSQETNSYSFAKQNSNYFFSGSGQLWQYIKNAIDADVTDDVLGYEIQEVAGATSSINLRIGNQDGKWYGPSPSGTGALAIAKNKKVLLYQGLYNSLGVEEYAPKNTYYIDDITQQVTSKQNDLVIQARDWNKKLQTTITRFSYNFKAPDYVSDTFDGSTIGNWNQTGGSWEESGGLLLPTQAPTTESIIVRTGLNIINSNTVLSVTLLLPNPSTTNSIAIYPIWVDSNNWMRFSVVGDGDSVNHTFKVDKCLAGSVTNIAQNGGNWSYNSGTGTVYLNVYYRLYGYQYFDFYISNAAITLVNSFNQPYEYSSAILLSDAVYANTPPYNLSGIALNNTDTIALSCTGYVGAFSNLKFSQYGNSNTIKEAVIKLGSKARITNYKFKNLISDYQFDNSKYTGTFSILNRVLQLTQSNMVEYNDTQIQDGEVEFDAKILPINSSASYSFDFILRNPSLVNTTQCYLVRFKKDTASNTTRKVELRSEDPSDGDKLVFESGVLFGVNPPLNDLDFDFSTWHHYRVTFVGEWITVYIDGIMVFAYIDNSNSEILSAGYFGFQVDSNSGLQVKNIVSSLFFNQINTFTLNPGDDIDSAMRSLSATIKAWNFSDLFGRFKSTLLEDTDVSDYTYQDLLWAQKTDASDKEYANQVTVIGQGVQAIARDTVDIGLTKNIRDEVIVDYKILTLKDAQTRAAYELNNFNKFKSQSDPKQPNNLGAEILDVVTVVNVDANTNAPVRVYNQDINFGEGQNSDVITLGTGQLS